MVLIHDSKALIALMALQRRETTFFGKERPSLAPRSAEVCLPDVVPGPDIPSVQNALVRHASPNFEDRNLAERSKWQNATREYHQQPPPSISITSRDPWQDYSKILKTRLGGPVTLASKTSAGEVFTIRRLANRNLDQQLHMLMQIRHEAILEAFGIYLHLEQYFVISPFLDLSVMEIMASATIRASERQIAVIVHQVGFLSLKPHG